MQLDSDSASTSTSCVTLERLLHLSEPLLSQCVSQCNVTVKGDTVMLINSS